MLKCQHVVWASLCCAGFIVADSAAAVGDRLWMGGSDCDSGTISYFECFAPAGAGVTENPNSDGFAAFSFDGQSGETAVDITITHFQPNTTYGIRYENEFGTGAELSQAVTTNLFGRGRWRDTNIQNITASPRVIVFIDDNNDFEYTPGEERACGGTNCNF